MMSNPYPPDSYGSSSSYDPYRQPTENYPQYNQSGEPYSHYQQPGNSYGQYNQPPIYAQPIVQPVYVQPVIMAQQTNGKAIASMVLGIVSWLGASILAGIPAIVLGHMALNEINNSVNTQSGKGMAITGLVLGYLSLVGIVCICLYFIVIIGSAPYSSY
jgi:hypothetical protein